MSMYTVDVIFEKLKRVAKQGRRENSSLSQAKVLDKVAAGLGYNNWSLLSRHLNKMSEAQLGKFHDALYEHPQFIEYLPPIFPAFDRAAAVREMSAWVESNFTPLIEFAFYDSESENGFAARDEDLVEALQDEFSDRFPQSLIEEVGNDLELDRGPWGSEDYGYNDEERE